MSPNPERLRDLVRDRLALDLSRRDEGWFEDLLRELAGKLGYADPLVLLETLEQEPLTSPAWVVAVDRLTIAETYFFRDQGQMELLRDHLLPGLMREAQGRRVRIWSAGCSTGEELYSIAMLLDGLGNPPADLLGTDINPAVVEQARRGIYRERSLRTLPAAVRSAYLQPHGREYQISQKLRDRVRFSVESLTADESRHLLGLDLIICRNVLIYFDRDQIPVVLERFYRALRPNGLLLTGHGELLTVETPFDTVPYPQSLVFRRPDVFSPRAGQPVAGRVVPPPVSASKPLAAPPAQAPSEGEPAQPGPSESAEPEPVICPQRLCQQARKERLEGKEVRARELLRKALYLDPENPMVYLEMGLLSAPRDPERARKHRSTALALLSQRGHGATSDPEVARALGELEKSLL